MSETAGNARRPFFHHFFNPFIELLLETGNDAPVEKNNTAIPARMLQLDEILLAEEIIRSAQATRLVFDQLSGDGMENFKRLPSHHRLRSMKFMEANRKFVVHPDNEQKPTIHLMDDCQTARPSTSVLF